MSSNVRGSLVALYLIVSLSSHALASHPSAIPDEVKSQVRAALKEVSNPLALSTTRAEKLIAAAVRLEPMLPERALPRATLILAVRSARAALLGRQFDSLRAPTSKQAFRTLRAVFEAMLDDPAQGYLYNVSVRGLAASRLLFDRTIKRLATGAMTLGISELVMSLDTVSGGAVVGIESSKAQVLETFHEMLRTCLELAGDASALARLDALDASVSDWGFNRRAIARFKGLVQILHERKL